MDGLRDFIEETMKLDERRLKKYKGIIRSIHSKGRLKSRFSAKRDKREYYQVFDGGRERYLGVKNEKTIHDLQMKRFANEMIKLLERNIQLKKDFCEQYADTDEADVMRKLPVTYQFAAQDTKTCKQSENPYDRESLKLKTSFGLLVRSKGELAIAEALHSLGIEFYYEKALELDVWRRDDIGGYWTQRTVYPDFTIALPSGDFAYWEHKGMMSRLEYAQRDLQKWVDYNTNHIYMPHNLMISEEGPENELDMAGIWRIINGWLLPMLEY